MRRSSLVLGALASLAAPVAAVTAYQSWAPPSPRAVDAQTSSSTVADHGEELLVRYRPCRTGDRLRHGTCVTHQVQVVANPLVGAAPAAAPGAEPAAPSAAPSSVPSPTHPVHALPGHHAHPGPTGGPGSAPTTEPTGPATAAPTCEPVEEDDRDGDAAVPTSGAPLSWVAPWVGASASGDHDSASAEHPANGCEDDDGDGDDDGDDDHEGHDDHENAGTGD